MWDTKKDTENGCVCVRLSASLSLPLCAYASRINVSKCGIEELLWDSNKINGLDFVVYPP